MAKNSAMLRVVTGNGIIPRSSWAERILTAFDVRKTRIDLSRLTDEQLADVGLTREEVEAELARPIWDAPAHWRK